MRLFVLFGMILFAAFILLNGCKADKLPPVDPPTLCDTVSVSYNSHVKSIIDAKCVTCHNGSQSPAMMNFTQVNAQTARIVERALNQQTMPPSTSNQLTNSEIDLLNCWKKAGFPEQ